VSADDYGSVGNELDKLNDFDMERMNPNLDKMAKAMEKKSKESKEKGEKETAEDKEAEREYDR